MVGLMLSPLDLSQGLQLLKLWADIEDGFNPQMTVVLCLRFDMDPAKHIPQQAVAYASKKFRVMIQRCKRKGLGWPAGCNALEVGSYEWFVEANRFGRIDFPYFLIAEPDTVPLRRGWAIEIMNEAYDSKALMIGAYFTEPDGCPHINGNCVIHRDLWKSLKAIWAVPSRRGWDAFIGPQALVIGKPSRLIWQDYRLGAPDNPWRGDDYLFEQKTYLGKTNPLYGERLFPSMFHGIKTLQGINAVRRKILGEK